MSTPSSIFLFPLLPKELRLNIWRHAANALNRTISIHTEKGLKTFSYSPAPIPLLSVSREARIETLKSYTLLSSEQLRSPCYFEPERDVVDVTESVVKNIQHVSDSDLVSIFEKYGITPRFVIFDKEEGERWDWNGTGWDWHGELRDGGRNRFERPPPPEKVDDGENLELVFLNVHWGRPNHYLIDE
jgi:hypothetical protein